MRRCVPQPRMNYFITVTICTYDAKQPHEGEAGGGVVGAVVEFGHLIVLPGVVPVREERRPLWVQSADRLRRAGGNWKRRRTQLLLWDLLKCKEEKMITSTAVISKHPGRHDGIQFSAALRGGRRGERQMKLVTFVQSQMNIRWCFPSDADQSFFPQSAVF